MQMFIINGIDFTRFITVPSYKVNELDVFDEWEDGNRRKHKYIVRSQIKGSFTLKFTNIDDFNNFFATVNSNKVATGDYAGAVLATVYMVNRNAVKSTYVFITADPADTLPLFASPSYDGFDVTIEEVWWGGIYDWLC